MHEKGLEEFALIAHSGAAEQVGLEMQEAKLLIFGSPKAGTPPRYPPGPRREHCGYRPARLRRSRGGLRSHGPGW